MHRIDGPGHDNNQFTEGDPQIPTPATTVTADILNALQEEIVSVIEGSGDTLDKADNSQLLQAIDALRDSAYGGFDRVTRRHDPYTNHVDTILHNSVYYFSDDGTKGTPLGSGWYFIETKIHGDDSYGFQTLYGIWGGSAYKRIWIRHRAAGGWGSWVEVSTAPVAAGSIVPFAGSTPPSGYFECNGAAVSRTTYAGLFTAIGTAWGAGDGSATFNLPDLRGKILKHISGARVVGDFEKGTAHTVDIGTGQSVKAPRVSAETDPAVARDDIGLDAGVVSDYGSGVGYYAASTASGYGLADTSENAWGVMRPDNAGIINVIKY